VATSCRVGRGEFAVRLDGDRLAFSSSASVIGFNVPESGRMGAVLNIGMPWTGEGSPIDGGAGTAWSLSATDADWLVRC